MAMLASPRQGGSVAAARSASERAAPEVPKPRVTMNLRAKRMLDVAGGSAVLLVSSPLMLGIAALIKLSSRGPVLFVQERVGYQGKKFPFFKFRSMHEDADDAIHRDYIKRWIRDGEASAQEVNGEKLHKLVDDPRVFRFGRFIRKYSLDELPQLFNVLRGEMSLVGPRPALPYEVDVYSPYHRQRFEGPPGLTGLWQVSGRNRVPFEEMVRLDIEYLENWSLRKDLSILFRTLRVVIFEPAS